jgi:phosphopantetheinyl transferase
MMLRVAIARIDHAPATGDGAAPGWMGADERRRWALLPSAARREFVASRTLLRGLLQATTGVPGHAWDVSAQAGAAPVARAARGDADVPCVSLSHRRGWVAAAVSNEAVGVDVECDRPARSDPGARVALMLSPDELPAWHAAAPDDLESALLTRWTIKEAWFKASPAQDSAWDFRRVVARACAPEHANVRAWVAAPLHVAICCADADELGRVECEGLDTAAATSTFWHVARAAPAD